MAVACWELKPRSLDCKSDAVVIAHVITLTDDKHNNDITARTTGPL